MSVKEENILTYSKMTDPVTTNTRNFNGLQEPKKMCVFFLKGQCTRGSSCKFSHNIRDSMTNLETTQPLTQKQITINEIEDAIRFGNLNEIFRKMLTTEEDYIKYYFELHMKFRGIAVMNLKGESIVRNIIDRISLRNVTINGSTLKYGFMPFLFHFIMIGYSWNTFQGARNDTEYNKVSECFDDIINQLQKVKVKGNQIAKYNDQEYEAMVMESCEFVDPETYDNTIHVASHYLCDRVVQHIKDVFKSNARGIMLKSIGEEELSKKRIAMGETEFSKLLNENFNNILNETNKEDKKAYDLFMYRKDNKTEAIDKYKSKYDKAIKRARCQEHIDDATERLAYNLKQLDRKIDIFYTSIFSTQKKINTFINFEIDYNAKFTNYLSKLHGVQNKWGTRIEIIELVRALHLTNTELKQDKNNCMKMLIDVISIDIMNSRDVIQSFKDSNNIDYLWNAIIKSITVDTPATFSVDVLNTFFKEEQLGLRESYIGQYLEKLYTIGKTLSSEQKQSFIDSIMKTVITKDVKAMINL